MCLEDRRAEAGSDQAWGGSRLESVGDNVHCALETHALGSRQYQQQASPQRSSVTGEATVSKCIMGDSPRSLGNAFMKGTTPRRRRRPVRQTRPRVSPRHRGGESRSSPRPRLQGVSGARGRRRGRRPKSPE